MTLLTVLLGSRRKRGPRWRCIECGGRLFRRYQGTRIHKKCWIAIEAGLR